jgi:hypothetical protein
LKKINYLVDMHDRRKRRRVFHVNMLKDFKVRRAVETCYWAGEMEEEETDSDIPGGMKTLQGNQALENS